MSSGCCVSVTGESLYGIRGVVVRNDKGARVRPEVVRQVPVNILVGGLCVGGDEEWEAVGVLAVACYCCVEAILRVAPEAPSFERGR